MKEILTIIEFAFARFKTISVAGGRWSVIGGNCDLCDALEKTDTTFICCFKSPTTDHRPLLLSAISLYGKIGASSFNRQYSVMMKK